MSVKDATEINFTWLFHAVMVERQEKPKVQTSAGVYSVTEPSEQSCGSVNQFFESFDVKQTSFLWFSSFSGFLSKPAGVSVSGKRW